MTNFVSLHNHTDLSILDSLSSIKDLFAKAKELGQSAIAITDHGSIAGAWDGLKISKTTGVKLIIGCECYFQDNISEINNHLRHIILIAKNAIGYNNLLTINKKGFDQNPLINKKTYSIVDWKLLEQYSEGLICLTACGNGIINQLLINNKFEEAEQSLLKLKNIYGDNLGLEIQPNNMKRGSNIYNDSIEQKFFNNRCIELGKKHNIRIVPTCNSHYINKEDHVIHDVLLSIGSHQPISSTYRLKYPVPEFYLKSGDEIKTFFSRNYEEEFVSQICENSIYFADLCENPDWIDPKYSNSSGKELPVFPVKDEVEYYEFIKWLSKQSDLIKSLDYDKSYLRYLCDKNFNKRIVNITKEKLPEYHERLNKELDILEYQDFSSYMLVVADYVNWARENDIIVGAGRGCLTGDSLVQTNNGFIRLDEIKKNDYVYSHTGSLKKVINTFNFDVTKETLLKIKLENAFGEIKLTRNHKIFACKKTTEKVFKNPEWIDAKELKCGDYIYTTFPELNNKIYDYTFDLANFADPEDVFDDKIKIKNNIISDLSIREIERKTKLSFGYIRKAKNNELDDKSQISIIEDYLKTYSISIDDWRKIPKYNYYYINRFIKLDNEFLYVLGRWVGDGCIRHKQKNGINYAFNIEEKLDISRIKDYYKKIGFNVYGKENNKKGYNLDIGTTILSKLFCHIFPDYKNTSYSKHLPIFFRSLDKNQLKCLIEGIVDSDGHLTKYNESIKTISLRLAKELKECFNLLKIKSSVFVEQKNKDYGRNNAISYKLFFSGIKIKQITKSIFNNGYFSKIIDITNCNSDKVYDITVEEDHSYLTSSGIVHNSVGGSIVAFLLGIHQADPIKNNLIFERFINKDRTAFPDIDLDFSTINRDLVKQYLQNKYGEDYVAHVSNINTITPKVYVRDIARACELGGSRESAIIIGNGAADCIPADIHSIDDAINKLPLFVEYCNKYPEFIKYKTICGKYRAKSTHAGGIIISKRLLTGLIPLRKDKDNSLSIEYDKDKAEENGLVKMDILGLSTLDIINETLKLIKKSGKQMPAYPFNYEEYDKKTYDLISKGDTFCVFQLGKSAGTIDLCKKIKPQNIFDIANINALARPSSKDIRDDFIATRNGKKPITLLHPSLNRAFGSTYGFGLYEECLMYLAQDVAGWSLHEADRLRKLTKEKGKNPEKTKKWRAEFIADAVKNNIKEETGKRIWDELVSNFSGYGFNSSHAILYSMIGYETAFLKTYYPIEFLLANLKEEVNSNAQDAKSNIEKIKKELKLHKVKIIPPNINESQLTYTIVDGNKLITGLDTLKFLGEDAIKDIIKKRPFNSFFDFMLRVDSRKVRANSIQALAASGSLDCFNISRKLIYLYCSDYRKKLKVWTKRHDPSKEEFVYPWTEEIEWKLSELYALEQFYLGESFACKPSEAYGSFFNDDRKIISDIKKTKDRTTIHSVKVIVKDFFEFKVKKEGSKYFGQPMIKALVEDKYGDQCTCTIFPDKLRMVKDRIKQIHSKIKFEPGLALHFYGNTNYYDNDMGIILENLYNISTIPSLPINLKSRKVNIKESKSLEKNKIQSLSEEIEDELINEGLIDFDSDFD